MTEKATRRAASRHASRTKRALEIAAKAANKYRSALRQLAK